MTLKEATREARAEVASEPVTPVLSRRQRGCPFMPPPPVEEDLLAYCRWGDDGGNNLDD